MWTGDALQWFGIFISLLLIYYGVRYQFSKTQLDKQLYSAYLPMFRILEPFLYKKSESIGLPRLKEISNELLQIINNHYELIEPDIIHWTRKLDALLTKNATYSEIDECYKLVCRYVDKNFELTRKKMFLPTRGISYRLNNRQYAYKFRMYVDMAILLSPVLLIGIVAAILNFMISRFISQ